MMPVEQPGRVILSPHGRLLLYHAISNEMHWTGLAGVQTNTCAACSLADVTNAWSGQDAGDEKDSAGR